MPVVRVNFVRGTLSLALDAGAVIVAADALTDLPLVADPDVAWLSLDPYAEHGPPEIVKVTAHSPGASTATVVRAQQTGEGGSAARDHPAGTTVEQAVTVLDLGVIEDDVLAAAADAADALASAATKVPLSQKGAANGVASLGADTKIPTSQLPTLAINDIYTVASQAAMLALPAQQGDFAIRSDVAKTFILGDEPATVLGNWIELPTPVGVSSINGQTGVVTLAAADVGAATPASVTAEANARIAADALLIPLTQRAAANGVATLDGSGKINTAQLPALAITDTFVVATQAAMLALTAEPGDVAIRTDYTPRRAFILKTAPASTLGNWEALDPATVVTSVNGLTGDVTGLIPTTQKGAANGVATLDATTRLPSAQAPLSVPTLSVSTRLGVGVDVHTDNIIRAVDTWPSSVGRGSFAFLAGDPSHRIATPGQGIISQLYPAAWSDPGQTYAAVNAHINQPAGSNFVPWAVIATVTTASAKVTTNPGGLAGPEAVAYWGSAEGSGGCPLWGFVCEVRDHVGATIAAADIAGLEVAMIPKHQDSVVTGVDIIAKGDVSSDRGIYIRADSADADAGWDTGIIVEVPAIPMEWREQAAAAGVGRWRWVNDAGDLRLDHNTHASGIYGTFTTPLHIDANGNVGLAGAQFSGTGGFGGGVRVVGIANAATVPTSNPTLGPLLYGQAGALKARGTSGTIATLVAADPHCPDCGRDFVLEWANDNLGRLTLCMWCVSEGLDRGVMERVAA